VIAAVSERRATGAGHVGAETEAGTPPRNATTIAVMAALHAGALIGLALIVIGRVAWPTLALAGLLWAATGLSITAGYHRLFAHRSYRASPVLRWVFLVFGAAAFQNSALAWSADHRDHHAHSDGPGDPYSITRGFWWAHMGWMFRSRPGSASPEQRLTDLARHRSVVLQHRWYAAIAIAAGLALPTALGALWGDPLGGLLVAGALRAVVVLQATFCINSVAHFVGRRTYDRASTARDSIATALITFGEGFHSFHHRFQADYRNGVRWWHFDPGKWLIWACERVRLVQSVRRTARSAIHAARTAAASPATGRATTG
jgi:stearoyl-CoA desaturase (delta-9 desaturase)